MRGLKKKWYVWHRVSPRPQNYVQKQMYLLKRWALLWANSKGVVFKCNCAQESGGALVCSVR
eukprot:2923430-Alexandrium_andersonii.AAC.1